MSTEDRRIAGLRAYHAQRPEKTRAKLTEALDRIESTNTAVIKPGARLTKANLCREAGVNIHTLNSKDAGTGERRYADVLGRFEKLTASKRKGDARGDDRDEKIAELRELYRGSEENKTKMAREIDRVGMELLRANEEIARLSALDRQNAELREEIRSMQSSGGLRLVGKGEG